LKESGLNKNLVYTSQVLREVLIYFYYVFPNYNKNELSIKLINIEKCNIYIKSLFLYNIATHNVINSKFVEQKFLEFNWTLVPCLVLILISIPSFHVLYINEEIINPALTVNIMGHQWFWSYDYTDLFPYWFNLVADSIDIDEFVIESYMEPEEFLRDDRATFRLYETEEPLFLPVRIHLRLMISSFDTLHSFALPSMGLKVDAVPGRINQLELFIKRSGLFFGQCSEICGVGHAFMPIEVHAISYLNFLISAIDPLCFYY
jgi:cytochrome c oxidase subunit 2